MTTNDNEDAEFTPQPMPLLTISSRQTIDKCRNFPLLEKDVYICSYPKSGTTWLQHIILTLILLDNHESNVRKSLEEPLLSLKSRPSSEAPPMYRHVSDYAPFFEIDAHWEENEARNVPWICSNHSQIGRRIFNTHLRFNMLPSLKADANSTTGSSKFIYIIRSPLDTCTSFYAHLSNQVEGGYEKSMDFFFSEWMNGKIPYGSWDDHVLSYMLAFSSGSSRKVTLDDGREFLLILYQEMVQNMSDVVAELIDFLQLDIPMVAHQETDLLRHFSFEYMSQNIDHFQPKSVTWKNQFKFLRGGRTGDGGRTMSAIQQVEYKQYLKKRYVQNRLSQMLTMKRANYDVFCMVSPYISSSDVHVNFR